MKIKTAMPKSGKLITAYKTGGEAFRKYCLTYGTIVYDKSYDDIDGKPLRHYSIHIDGLCAHVDMKNGETIGYGYKLIEGA